MAYDVDLETPAAWLARLVDDLATQVALEPGRGAEASQIAGAGFQLQRRRVQRDSRGAAAIAPTGELDDPELAFALGQKRRQGQLASPAEAAVDQAPPDSAQLERRIPTRSNVLELDSAVPKLEDPGEPGRLEQRSNRDLERDQRAQQLIRVPWRLLAGIRSGRISSARRSVSNRGNPQAGSVDAHASKAHLADQQRQRVDRAGDALDLEARAIRAWPGPNTPSVHPEETARGDAQLVHHHWSRQCGREPPLELRLQAPGTEDPDQRKADQPDAEGQCQDEEDPDSIPRHSPP